MSEDKASVIAEKLKKDIGEGKYGADSPLPSVRALMKKHGIARSTANRVLQHLVQTGFAECRIGSGMYPVVKKPITFAVILPETEKPFHAALLRTADEKPWRCGNDKISLRSLMCRTPQRRRAQKTKIIDPPLLFHERIHKIV